MSPLLFNLYTEGLISRIQNSGFGCYVGDVCASVVMYADDIALLAPTRYSMQKLLELCVDFGDEFNLTFNAEKSETIIFGNLARINLYLDNKIIPIVNKVNYLGHHLYNRLGHNNDIFDINPIVSDIKIRTNVILSYFNFLTINSKIKVFNTNCSSYYGCVLSNQADKSLESLNKTWRICTRKVMTLPARTHCNIIPSLMVICLPQSKLTNEQSLSFIKE